MTIATLLEAANDVRDSRHGNCEGGSCVRCRALSHLEEAVSYVSDGELVSHVRSSGSRKCMYVMPSVISRNVREKTFKPTMIVRREGVAERTVCHEVDILEASTLTFSPLSAVGMGAHVWVETHGPIKLYERQDNGEFQVMEVL